MSPPVRTEFIEDSGDPVTNWRRVSDSVRAASKRTRPTALVLPNGFVMEPPPPVPAPHSPQETRMPSAKGTTAGRHSSPASEAPSAVSAPLGGSGSIVRAGAQARSSRGGLGRRYAPDPRDIGHPMRALLQRKQMPSLLKGQGKTWYAPTSLDQGMTPRCVGYAMTQFLRATPVSHPGKQDALRAIPDSFAAQVYAEAQRVDEWDGEAYEGTSVRAGCRVLVGRGLVREYLWSSDAEEVALHILSRGPVVVGTTWFDGMDEPVNGVVKVTGNPIGGHAYTLLGYSPRRRSVRILNSWGPEWGEKGRAWLSLTDLQYLLGDTDGEAVSMVEVAA